MIKKIVLATTLLASLVHADRSEKGFFVGADISYFDTETAFSKKGSIITTSNYKVNEAAASYSLKAGYQYYFTRVYLRANNKKKLKDTQKERFEIENQLVELNIDYLPIFYKSKEHPFMIKGIAGVGVGANRSSLTYYDARLDSIGTNVEPILNKETQWLMEYGGQLGVMAAFDFGLDVELAYRYRSGLMTQFSSEDESAQVTFKQRASEVYLGANYMF